ncbi:MAG TPA: cellulase N-terminal Ig-like domain-containing protein, partial [Polyangia bacterium]
LARVVDTTDHAGAAGTFAVVDGGGAVVFSGALEDAGAAWGKHFWRADFSALVTAGQYVLRASIGGTTATSDAFPVAPDATFRATAELATRFFAIQRCGVAVPGWHDACHADDGQLADDSAAPPPPADGGTPGDAASPPADARAGDGPATRPDGAPALDGGRLDAAPAGEGGAVVTAPGGGCGCRSGANAAGGGLGAALVVLVVALGFSRARRRPTAPSPPRRNTAPGRASRAGTSGPPR